VVAGARRLKVVFFPAYRGRHPQSGEAVLAEYLTLTMLIRLRSVSHQTQCPSLYKWIPPNYDMIELSNTKNTYVSRRSLQWI